MNKLESARGNKEQERRGQHRGIGSLHLAAGEKC